MPPLGRQRQVDLCDFETSEFQDSQSHNTDKTCLEKQKEKEKKRVGDSDADLSMGA